MAKHRRWSDKPKDNPPVQKNEEPELIQKNNTSKKESNDKKSLILSGTKYVYLVVAAALLSGIFTPLTLGVDFELVLSGILSIFLGLGGCILIFLGIKTEKFRSLMACGGMGMMIASLLLLFEVAGRSIFR
jgi:hypothetical protein